MAKVVAKEYNNQVKGQVSMNEILDATNKESKKVVDLLAK